MELRRTERAKIELTVEQRRIVAHDRGPALVFAVAGSGKTTAMVHRIERLVREQVFPARAILATSFSRAAVRDIRRSLERWPHCGGVHVATLHSVGYRIVRRAQEQGLLDGRSLHDGDAVELDRHLLFRTLDRARKERAEYKPFLDNLDPDDFLNYVGACKGNLRYADLAAAALPRESVSVAGQADPPAGLEWYLDLYRLFERVRTRENAITYDDMLMTGWEVLVRFPEVAQEMRGRIRCILVDEFQDVNLAQSEILDLLTLPERDYMAIGDDDQTIYEWRGASPHFILGFPERYGAARYLISDNFRSRASHLALANKVIERNTVREPKRLNLTQGFDGHTLVHFDESAEQMGRSIVGEIRSSLDEGYRPEEIAVLVRLYAQTPYIEYFLIETRIPYRVAGSSPFYQRTEVLGLIDYFRVAAVERDLQAGKPLADDAVAEFGRAWMRIYNRPTRYLPRTLADGVLEAVVRGGASLVRTVLLESVKASGTVSENLEELAGTLKWLASVLDSRPANRVLQELEGRLDYKEFLRRTSGFPETGEGKAANVDAFIAYAREKGTPTEFAAHLDYIAFQRLGKNLEDEKGLITLMTIFRAKGLQWPVVFVPNCNQGTIPLLKGPRDGPALEIPDPVASRELEEERRLFYVAITRPQKTLHLHLLKGTPTSQFLLEADYEGTLGAVQAVRSAIERDPEAWETGDALALARHTQSLSFERYFTHWWRAPEGRAAGVARKVRGLFAAALRRNLSGALGVRAEHAALWDRLAPAGVEDPSEDEFADLEGFLPPPPEG